MKWRTTNSHYFGVKAERLPVEQGQLFEETLAADMAAITEELAQLSEAKPKGQAKRKPLPPAYSNQAGQ